MRAARASRPLAMLAGLLMATASVCGQMIITKSALAPAPPSAASPSELETVYPTDIDETTLSTPLLSYLGSGNVSAGLDCEPLLQTAGWPAAAAVAVGALPGAPPWCPRPTRVPCSYDAAVLRGPPKPANQTCSYRGLLSNTTLRVGLLSCSQPDPSSTQALPCTAHCRPSARTVLGRVWAARGNGRATGC
jgi:hypothetical protein